MKSIILFAAAMVTGTQAIGTQWWGRPSKPEAWKRDAPGADTSFGMSSFGIADFGFDNFFGVRETRD